MKTKQEIEARIEEAKTQQRFMMKELKKDRNNRLIPREIDALTREILALGWVIADD